ncbi:F-box domain containing protein [Pandoravirus quercus]|uniref:F-box domain containing protein n=1 Tax=Pandoravirus quercus TaxID=2107709 RepID=A0A2U7U948_9VIRU|nr:F-box domain containing protein [Pandoravirus quercus]AVK74959.1 F-box domain containing protein [Pandoravirus quercus]
MTQADATMTTMDHDQGDKPSNGMLSSLPLELLARILNGHGSVGNPWRRRLRPLLDPRWRFAARAVCRLWRDVIEHPSAEDTAAMGKHPHRRWNQVHEYTPTGCPKWPTGRVVCMTAVADWIAVDPAPWIDDPEALYAWCHHQARASRKHVVTALVACGAPWAMAHVFDHHWPRLAFVASRAPTDPMPADADDPFAPRDRGEQNDGFRAEGPSSARMVGEYDNWDVDGDGDVEGLVDVLTKVSLGRGLGGAHRALCQRFGYDESKAYLSPVIRGGHAQLLGNLINAGAEMACYYWQAAVETKNTACLAKLLDLGLPYIPSPHPRSRLPSGRARGDEPAWVEEAVTAGNIDALILCDTRGIPFDANVAFVAAAAANRPSVMQWLWDRQTAQRNRAPPDDLAKRTRALDLDVDAAVLASITYEHSRSKRREASLAWLCDERQWTPRGSHPTLHLAALVEHACAQRAVRCAALLAERWPRTFLDAGLKNVLLVIGQCREEPDGLDIVLRMSVLLDRYAGDPAATDAPNLWPGLFAAQPMRAYRAERLVQYVRHWTSFVYALSIGEVPTDDDTCAICLQPDEPCACTRHPMWEHTDDNWQAPTVPGAQDDVVTRMAPLRRWVRPVPLPVAAILPDVAQSVPRAHREMVDWLAARHLVLASDQDTTVPVPNAL